MTGRLPRTLLALALLLPGPGAADRLDQRAADLYAEGRKLIRAGRYREGAEKVNAALSRGATEPNNAQGSEQRFKERRYDPYYWLGVAQMELGLTEQALANLEKSESIVPAGRSTPVIADWPEEWADLKRRKALLLARLEPPPPPRAEAAPAATPTPLAIRLPERPAGPVAVATAPPVPPAATAADTPGPAGLTEALVASLAAARDGRPVEAEKLAEGARLRFPTAPQPDLLLAALRGGRYLLEGEKDPRLLAAARAAHAAWRAKVGPARPLPPFVSPRTAALLAGGARPGAILPAASPQGRGGAPTER